jgi:hypothetical protein
MTFIKTPQMKQKLIRQKTIYLVRAARVRASGQFYID